MAFIAHYPTMKSKFVKLKDFKQPYFSRGGVFQINRKETQEEPVEFMILFNGTGDPTYMGLLIRTGPEAGRILVNLPNECLDEGTRMINKQWLLKNWEKYVCDCDVKDVLYKDYYQIENYIRSDIEFESYHINPEDNNNFIKLADYEEDFLDFGGVFRLDAEWPYEEKVDFIISEIPSSSKDRKYALVVSSGVKSGHILVFLPNECLDENEKLSKNWMLENWEKWVYPEADIQNVYYTKRYNLS
ncbi:Imm45 family immunity protein [Swingsia samuiensis]|uniref:Immunity protein 45 domain-containing protein n=1 Tax=Swingsia samuiensis TaxID=1293412 RepID=A0A4Y6ULY1_9PROT|nr:Imm45 family immunity protein [Swingsia samuiensis]QDH17401.1 hypothetical protein E3D00_07360 [Swingsia samuiensis]